jgi:hypothetical protein
MNLLISWILKSYNLFEVFETLFKSVMSLMDFDLIHEILKLKSDLL